jgi:DNA-binding XRE family transcriptional regulator
LRHRRNRTAASRYAACPPHPRNAPDGLLPRVSCATPASSPLLQYQDLNFLHHYFRCKIPANNFYRALKEAGIYNYFDTMDACLNVSDQLQYVISQIKKIRTQKGFSQMTLSLESNLSQSFLASIEKGKKMPSLLTIIKIANALDVSPKELF